MDFFGAVFFDFHFKIFHRLKVALVRRRGGLGVGGQLLFDDTQAEITSVVEIAGDELGDLLGCIGEEVLAAIREACVVHDALKVWMLAEKLGPR